MVWHHEATRVAEHEAIVLGGVEEVCPAKHVAYSGPEGRQGGLPAQVEGEGEGGVRGH